MSLLNDRLTRGLTAGFIAFIPVTVFNNIMYHLKLSQARYLDFASVFIYGHKSQSAWEELFAYLVTVFFTSGMGIVFAYLIPILSHRNIIIKGTVFSAGAWFLFYTVTILFNVPELKHSDLATSVSNLIGAVIWGLVLGYSLRWLDKKGKEKL